MSRTAAVLVDITVFDGDSDVKVGEGSSGRYEAPGDIDLRPSDASAMSDGEIVVLQPSVVIFVEVSEGSDSDTMRGVVVSSP